MEASWQRPPGQPGGVPLGVVFGQRQARREPVAQRAPVRGRGGSGRDAQGLDGVDAFQHGVHRLLTFGVQQQARAWLHAEGEQKVRAVLVKIDAIEAMGIAAIEVSPAYWRTLGNRLAARLSLPDYTADRHAAWLAGRAPQ